MRAASPSRLSRAAGHAPYNVTMRTLIALLASLGAVAASAPSGASAAGPRAPTISDAGRTQLSSFLTAAVHSGDVPGIVALVTSADSELYVEAVGNANVAERRPMGRGTIFRIASMTKPLTSVAAMMLYEQGKLALDEPVSAYLPDYVQPPVVASFDPSSGRVTTRPAQRLITIRHLLTHTSGIGYGLDDPILAALQSAGTKGDELPLVHDPGEKWTYGSNTYVLGRVVEKVSGQPLDALFRSRIFDPLEMADTFYRVPDEKHERLVTRHQRKDGTLTETPNSSIENAPVRGDGGLSSTAHDYGAFLRMLLNGGDSGRGRLLSARTVGMMTRNQIGNLTLREMPAAMPAIARSFPAGAGHDTFGFGFQVAARGTSARSRGSYSWAGVYNTYFWVDPERRIGVVLLMQILPFFDDACKRLVSEFEDRLYRIM